MWSWGPKASKASEPQELSARRGGSERKVGCPRGVSRELGRGLGGRVVSTGCQSQVGLGVSSGSVTFQCPCSVCGCSVPSFNMGIMRKLFSLKKGRKGSWMNPEDIMLSEIRHKRANIA